MLKVGAKLKLMQLTKGSWAGSVSGKLGQPTADGFEVVEAGVQIFEKKAKEPKPEATSVDADSVPVKWSPSCANAYKFLIRR